MLLRIPGWINKPEKLFLQLCVEYDYCAPLRPPCYQVLAVRAHGRAGQRSRSVGRELVGVEEDPGLSIQLFGNVENALVLKPCVACEEIEGALFLGKAITLIVPEQGEFVFEFFMVWKGLEVGERYLDLPGCLRTRLLWCAPPKSTDG